MNTIIKARWFIIAGWIAVVAVLFTIAPNMADLVREKGQISVPNGYSSTMADEILNKVQKEENASKDSQVALVFHNEKGLTEEDEIQAKAAINILEEKKAELGITGIITHFNEIELEKQLVSEDGTTILISLSVDKGNQSAEEISDKLYEAIEEVNLSHYYTSSWMIDEALVKNSEEGLKKTEWITVVFILSVLLIVFRSIITPFIPLVTVLLTYLASQSIVALLVDKVNFPLSNFTQIFLVAVLFGIGTDYCILLLSRFKEEMSKTENVSTAIIETYKNAGRTVFFSGLAVMIGFAAIGLSTFKLYQSASAVAIGVAILLLALVTIVPFFMAVLGPKLFWPSKGKLEHKDSKLWDIVGRFSLARPLIAILIVAAIVVPSLLTYDGKLSFNSLEELSDDVPAIKAFDIIAAGFGPGESMPTTIVIKNDEEMNTSEYLALTEKISQELVKVDQVGKVRSATRPTGEPIEDLFVAKQAETLGEGLGEGNDGIEQISNGLQDASDQLTSSAPELETATSGIGDLISGTTELKNGIIQLQAGLSQIEQGLREGSAGSGQIKTGLDEIKKNAERLSAGSKELLNGYKQVGSTVEMLAGKYGEVHSGLSQISEYLQSTNSYFSTMESNPGHQALLADPEYQQSYYALKQTVLASAEQTKTIVQGLSQVNEGLYGLVSGISEANSSFETIINGQTALIGGMDQLIKGISQQQTGLEAAANGQGEIISRLSSVDGGLKSINLGQQQLLDGFKDLNGQMTQLTDGLTQSADGLGQVSEGLYSAQDYLEGLSSNGQMTGFYIPEDVLVSNDFEHALDAYMSQDRKVMTMEVIFTANPYSSEALEQIDEIKASVERAVKGTKLENATVAIGGVTSVYSDLDSISEQDYTRTVILMLAGISIILVVLLRSFIMPMYLIGSLILTYYTSMAITEMIFVNLLEYSGISWAVPFFAFVILVALGIDYSIFLMDRFNEYKHLSVQEAILVSMRKMGTVIISAAVILGGTFAAMMPSGVLSLLQIATILLTGLFLYGFVMLPLFVPVMVKTFGKANWWPFLNQREYHQEDQNNNFKG
ncbi:MMPL family transporter [Litchfieldia salsa]|uniref:Putative drug exporter of the RND superfamily n=1 Tax=Litchfieldia salsa TaxID=930152 RepID=A0A1H0UVY0_9BACI|nr:MMPL family transporter [Litchfieldia salsa]SDP69956.1 putative drug exporter of the RND superfamily [Litchfieldia salsa]